MKFDEIFEFTKDNPIFILTFNICSNYRDDDKLGRMLSDGNLSPTSQKKASDSSFLNS